MSDNNNTLTLEEMIHKRKYTIQSIRKRNKKKMLYQTEYKYLNLLQEPRNRYEMFCKLSTHNDLIEKHIQDYIKKGLIVETSYNPNKLIITQKGRLLLHKIKDINNYYFKHLG